MTGALFMGECLTPGWSAGRAATGLGLRATVHTSSHHSLTHTYDRFTPRPPQLYLP